MPVYRPSAHDSKQIEQTREILRDSEELLNLPKPDSFAGRKTQEPPRFEDSDPMDRADIQKLIYSELRPPE
ncbi:hypothetical protein [Bradyrhizobium zhanjiangense]|uniref:Uncharacterized protein n=1 Tax=Bradyrhizobium zhanjiangense TaxID=1325107 RepID=A0ABY0DFV9_9BRAD|nr:hypothetical protein [Bradyrhizobium zhanjiangense]RXG91574.1 hypothetical protein EAS62_24145 [Bradyrhizobium zhanjiangense]